MAKRNLYVRAKTTGATRYMNQELTITEAKNMVNFLLSSKIAPKPEKLRLRVEVTEIIDGSYIVGRLDIDDKEVLERLRSVLRVANMMTYSFRLLLQEGAKLKSIKLSTIYLTICKKLWAAKWIFQYRR